MHSLRARMMTAFVLPTAAIVVVLVAVAYISARQGMEDELAQRLAAVGQVVAADMSDGIDASQISRLDESMPRVRSRLLERLEAAREATGVRRIFIFDREAGSLVDTEESAFGSTLYRIQADRGEWGATFADGVTTTGPLFQAEDGEFHKTAYVPIFLDGQIIAAIGVEASATYFDLLTGFATVLTLLGALGVGVVIVIGLWFSKLLVRPVDALVDAAGRLADGDMKTPLDVDSSGRLMRTDELDFLTDSFEEMRRSIVERDQQMQLMLAGIAHEVRNPLGGMELFCGLLKEDLQAAAAIDDREKKLEMVSRIEREVQYLGRVVGDFLDFARPEGLKPERLDGGLFLGEIADLVASDVSNARCRLEMEIEEGVELTADPGRIRRGVLNVIRNACQACSADDLIVLRCRAVDDIRIIEVVDEGDGIAEDQIEKLTRPFFTTREKGSGLGLSLTRQIIEDHGGRLEIESQIGQGTTIRFRLPFDESVKALRSDEQVQEAVPQGWLG